MYILHELLSDYFFFNDFPIIYIYNIKIDSRLVKKGDLFVALKGNKFDGKNYIFHAILNGAISILTYSNISKSYYYFSDVYNMYVFCLYKINFFLPKIVSKFYNNPSKKLLLSAVTGTNGKSTVVYISAQWLNLLGYNSFVLSTLGNGFYGNLNYSLNTTCSCLEIQNYLKLCCDKNVDFVSIEVSSHALQQYRVSSLFFSSAIFTNLSIDHLDYHLNIKNYELSKWKLFSEYNINNLIINIDDKVGFNWFKKLSKDKVIPVTISKKKYVYFSRRWIYVSKIKFFGFLKKIYFNSYWGNGVLKIFILGFYNIMNILLSFTSLLSLGFNFKDLIYYSKYLVLPEGRMEFFYKKNKPLVIVDYAHTPDALKNILIESKKFCRNKLWCVFGCTGNRDRNKRPIMGKIAKKYSDIVIITNDDTYFENEISILKDIKSGICDFSNVYIILNRILAIKFALESASYNDVILITGKGHENFQIILNNRIKYSDRILVSKLLGI